MATRLTNSDLDSYRSGGSYNDSETPADGFDGSTNTKFCLTNFTSVDPYWLILDAGARYFLENYYYVYSANDASERDPRDWLIQGSNDKSNWTTIDEVDDNGSWGSRKSKKTFYYSSTSTAYRYYRIYIQTVQSGSIMQFSEWQIFTDAIARHITLSAGANGSISGSSYVKNGTSETWTITPDSGYIITSVVYGGSYQSITDPTGMDFTDSNVTSDTTLSVSFGKITHTAQWKLNDDAANTTVVDTTGNHSGTSANNTSTLSTVGKINDCFDFNGSSDWVSIADDSEINLREVYQRSYSLWVKLDDTTSRQVLYKEGGGTNALAVYQESNKIYFTYNDSGSLEGYCEATLSDNDWHHVVATFDSTNSRQCLYIDGLLKDTDTNSQSIGSHSGNISIAYNDGSYFIITDTTSSADDYLDGKLDDIRVYNKELSYKEVHTLYQGGDGTESVITSIDPPELTALLAHWAMDDNAANSTVVDSSGNGFNGTYSDSSGAINSSTGSVSGKIGTALDFDGADESVNCGDVFGKYLFKDLAVSFWLNPDNLGAQRENPIDKAYGGELGITLEDDPDAGKLSVYHGQAGDRTSPYMAHRFDTGMINGSWFHIVLSRDVSAQTVKCYVDKVEKSDLLSNTWQDPSESSWDLTIGKGYTNTFNGQIDDVRIYTKPLNQIEVNYLYALGARRVFNIT